MSDKKGEKRLFKLEPSEYEGDNKDDRIEGFSGYIMLSCPTFSQRMGYMKECGVKLNAKGEMEPVTDPIGQIAAMVNMSQKHYVEVSLKHESGSQYRSYNDIATDPACDKILTVVSGLILKGFRPSPL